MFISCIITLPFAFEFSSFPPSTSVAVVHWVSLIGLGTATQ